MEGTSPCCGGVNHQRVRRSLSVSCIWLLVSRNLCWSTAETQTTTSWRSWRSVFQESTKFTGKRAVILPKLLLGLHRPGNNQKSIIFPGTVSPTVTEWLSPCWRNFQTCMWVSRPWSPTRKPKKLEMLCVASLWIASCWKRMHRTSCPDRQVQLTRQPFFKRAVLEGSEQHSAGCDWALLHVFYPCQVSKAVCQFSHPGMGIHTLQELSLLKGETLDKVLSTIRKNTTQLYGI